MEMVLSTKHNPLVISYSVLYYALLLTCMVHTNSQTVFIPELLTNNQSLCLFQFSSDILMNMENSSLTLVNNKHTLPYITRSFTQLKPVLIMKCFKNNCSSQLDSSFLNGMYFLYTFHSSIWSLILLYTLTKRVLTNDSYVEIVIHIEEHR
uniref:Uncharacterized protein n=1 Tax=Schistosoma haematobium TaxID=6185 RepID=A0A095A2V0_SCHHA